MSSHREAPEISMDPVADNTDVYAFVSPDKPDTVTLIANFIPLQGPDGGPNFFAFGDDVLYEIHISNNQTGEADVSYQFRFTIELQDQTTFLYNTGPITSLTDKTYNRRQFYDVSKVVKGGAPSKIATHVPVPPCNIGIHSTPNYPALAAAAITGLSGGGQVFAGQRAEGFFADLGALFDLADIRPLQNLHTGPLSPAMALDSLQGLNVNTIAIQVPKTEVTKGGVNPGPGDVAKATSVIGVYASASRQSSRMYDPGTGKSISSGAWVQVSRLGNPLFNEVLIPIAKKDMFNGTAPKDDSQFADRVAHPELAKLLPALYPGVFPTLAAYTKARADLAAIFLTGLPAGVVPNFQNNTGTVQAELLRLNLAIPPTAHPNIIGLIAGDAAGFPNGRRLEDDVVTIELRALAGATIPLVDKTYVPDNAVGALSDFATQTNGAFLPTFPYLGTPNSGFATKPKNHDTGGGAGSTPVGGAGTGAGGTSTGRSTELLIGGAVAAAGAVAAGGAYHHTRPTPATDGVPADTTSTE